MLYEYLFIFHKNENLSNSIDNGWSALWTLSLMVPAHFHDVTDDKIW